MIVMQGSFEKWFGRYTNKSYSKFLLDTLVKPDIAILIQLSLNCWAAVPFDWYGSYFFGNEKFLNSQIDAASNQSVKM